MYTNLTDLCKREAYQLACIGLGIKTQQSRGKILKYGLI